MNDGNPPSDPFQEPSLPPPTSRELDQLQYHISLQEMGETLQKAANATYPNGNRSRYTTVYVLLLCWEDEDPKLPVSMEVNELGELFCDAYHFGDVEVWKIPSEGSHKRLNRKVLDFVELGGDSKDDLKIVYYGGHGILSLNRQSSWARYAYRVYFAATFVFSIQIPSSDIFVQPGRPNRPELPDGEMEWDSTRA
jgi:hypothetical protein